MLEYADKSPIITCSTGNSGNTAIAVLRLSGFSDFGSIGPFFSIKNPKPRYNHFSKLLAADGSILDEIIFSFYPAPHSYTGENVLELSVHGNVLNVQRILKMFCQHGFREALPGEFTFRALQNNKMSLSQVEGLDLLLNSSSAIAFSQGLELLHGELHKNYLSLYESLIKLKAHLELLIDFAEDIGEEEAKKLFKDALNRFKREISELHSRVNTSSGSLLNPKVVLLGETNAGKSTFFNLLLNYNRSIVSNIAGTTRDYVSEPLQIGDTLFTLFDTAGIRSTSDQIEEEGIQRAFKIIDQSFFRILMINPFETTIENLQRSLQFNIDIVIFSHADLSNFSNEILKFRDLNFTTTKYFSYSNKTKIMHEISLGPIEPGNEKSGPIEPKMSKNGPIGPKNSENGPIEPANFKIGPIEPVISKNGPIEPVIPKNGPIEPTILKNGPIEPVVLKSGPIEPVGFIHGLMLDKFNKLSANNPIFIARHQASINKIYSVFSDLECNFNNLDDAGILSSDISRLEASTKELVGYITPDSVLNSIFSNFCIGK